MRTFTPGTRTREKCSHRLDHVHEVLDRDGQTILDRFGQPKERPEVGILQNARISLLRKLALDGVDGPEAPRAPRTANYAGRR